MKYRALIFAGCAAALMACEDRGHQHRGRDEEGHRMQPPRVQRGGREGGREEGLKQFLDEKTIRPGLENYAR